MGVEKKIIGIDFDDTLFWREVGIRAFGHAKNLLLRPSFPNKILDEIPHYDHSIYDPRKTKITERISRVWHSRRTEIPGMAQMIRDELTAGTEAYGITGRKASKAWFEMTEDQLKAANIKLTGIRMTPKGVSGLLSKADSIRELGITEYYDDDRRTVRYLSRLFPNVQFHYIDHGLAHLSQKDLAQGNITVEPIEKFCTAQESKAEEDSTVRNSSARKNTDFINPKIESLSNRLRAIKAWQVTAVGVGFSIAGIELAEHQNRTGQYSVGTTTKALLLGLTGATFDLLDGKWARAVRKRMTDQKAKEKDELWGQVEDPLADGIIEAYQSWAAWKTARLRGDRFAQTMALFRLATTNLPRTAKAIAGCFGFKVPETYRMTDVLHGDISFFGTSLGRKLPNYGATLVNSAHDIPVQGALDVVASLANGKVSAKRLWTMLTPEGERELNKKEVKHAKVRAAVLGAESLAFLVLAGYLGKKIISKNNK